MKLTCILTPRTVKSIKYTVVDELARTLELQKNYKMLKIVKMTWYICYDFCW